MLVSIFQFRPSSGRFLSLNIILRNFRTIFRQIFVKNGQNRGNWAFRSKIPKWVVRTPENNCTYQISAFHPLSLPQKRTLLSCVFYENRYFQYFTIFQISKIHQTFSFQDIDLKFEIWVDNYLSFRWYALSFFDFGLKIGLKLQKNEQKMRCMNPKCFDF